MDPSRGPSLSWQGHHQQEQQQQQRRQQQQTQQNQQQQQHQHQQHSHQPTHAHPAQYAYPPHPPSGHTPPIPHAHLSSTSSSSQFGSQLPGLSLSTSSQEQQYQNPPGQRQQPQPISEEHFRRQQVNIATTTTATHFLPHSHSHPQPSHHQHHQQLRPVNQQVSTTQSYPLLHHHYHQTPNTSAPGHYHPYETNPRPSYGGPVLGTSPVIFHHTNRGQVEALPGEQASSAFIRARPPPPHIPGPSSTTPRVSHQGPSGQSPTPTTATQPVAALRGPSIPSTLGQARRSPFQTPRMSYSGSTAAAVAAGSSHLASTTRGRVEPYPRDRLQSRSQRLPDGSSSPSPSPREELLPQFDSGAYPARSFTGQEDHSYDRQGSGIFQGDGVDGAGSILGPRPSLSFSHPGLDRYQQQLHQTQQGHQDTTRNMGEYTLPGQAPVSVVYPQEHQVDVDHGYNNVLGQNDDVVMEEPDPLEVTLNIDLPKTTRSAEGEPSTTVLHVNPSWHCVFVETVQQERIRCWIRIQFCGSPKQMEHRALVCKLQSLQVIGYQSRQVELTRRICGKRLLNKGGIIIHLDPVAINYNDASYGFTVSLSSYPCDRLDRRLRPDEPLPLTRQQNSAFCRRNLKELYNDTFSKDVVVTLSPSREQFYVHSVVLENYGYFRKLSEEQGNGGDRQSPFRLRRQGSSRVGLSSFSSTLTGVGDVDEDGFAQPLNMSSQLASQLQQQQQQQQESDANQGSTSSASAPLPPPLQSPPPPPALNRPRISLQVEGTSPNVFRAILHFMYMGHIPTTAASCFQSVVIPSTTSTGTPTAQPRAVETTGASTSAAPAAEPTSTTVAPSSAVATPAPVPTPAPGSAAAVETTSPFDFSWTELYDTAVRFQLVGLTRLARLVLISRLDTGSAVHELMTWAYQHDTLIPCYLSYIIETVHPDQFKDSSRGSQSNPQMNAAATISRANSESNNSSSTSVLWSYRDKCPKFGDILLKIVQMLDERRPVFTTL